MAFEPGTLKFESHALLTRQATIPKALICHRYMLSTLTWNLPISENDITCVKQSLDMIVNRYVTTWLEIPIVGTFESFDNIQLSKGKFGI